MELEYTDEHITFEKELNSQFFDVDSVESFMELWRGLTDGGREGTFIPDMEVKLPRKTLDSWSLDNRRRVIVNGETLWISPLELQIAYKLRLGSEKDIEDARYRVFAEHIELLDEFLRKREIPARLRSMCDDPSGF